MRNFALIFVTVIATCLSATIAQAQTPTQIEAWKSQPHCHWKDPDGVVRPHPVIAFADANGIALVGDLAVKQPAPYTAVCSVHHFQSAAKQCDGGPCSIEKLPKGSRKSKFCKGEAPMKVKTNGIPIKEAGCRHVVR